MDLTAKTLIAAYLRKAPPKIVFTGVSPPYDELLSFARPKESNQRKGHPDAAPPSGVPCAPRPNRGVADGASCPDADRRAIHGASPCGALSDSGSGARRGIRGSKPKK